jgi:predicted DNA-binding protein with PD1-like motif
MSITLRHVNPLATRVFMGTLTDNVLIHEALAQVARTQHIHTATFELLGGLHEVELTAYDFVTQTRLKPLMFRGAMEIVSAHGTIALLDGQPHIHTHMTLAWRDETAPQGIVMIGGHVARAMAFAVEFTLTAYEGASVHRATHASTGLNLWDLEGLGE